MFNAERKTHMSKVNVMITGVGGGGVGEQILKCLRMKKKKNH